MSQNGAKHLILVSRHGVKTRTANELVAKLTNDGAYVYAPECDVSDSDAVKSMVHHARINMPPIKGCIQGSMIVEVGRTHSHSPRTSSCSL